MTRRGLIIAGALLATVLVVLAVVVPVVSVLRPEYYDRFPEIKLRMTHWATSTHSRIPCGDCHIGPGVGGLVSFTVETIPKFYSQLAQGPDETNLLKPPARVACQKCHTSYRSVAPSGDLLIPHRAHVEVLGLECVVCHKDLVHTMNRRGFNRPEMELCLAQCHDGDTATNECVKCHTRKQTPETHLASDWLQTHGSRAAFEDCDQCHDWTPGYCAECHEKRPASHVGNWKSAHAAPALERGEGCVVCHGGEEYCKQCH